MPSNALLELDSTDEAILRELQENGRITTAELGRSVSLSPSATADRLRRLTEVGILTGYRADVDLTALGYPILAFVRLRYPSGNYKPFHDLLATTPEVLEAHHITGDDCFLLKTAARSMPDLERITGKLAALGSITTNVVYSSPLSRRTISAAG